MASQPVPDFGEMFLAAQREQQERLEAKSQERTADAHNPLTSAELEDIARDAYRKGGYPAALRDITSAMKASRTPIASQLDLRAATNGKLGHHDAALLDAKMLIRQFGSDPSGYLRAVQILTNLKRPDMAVKIVERGLKAVPNQNPHYGRMEEKHRKLVEMITVETSVDPFSRLPLEVADLILSYLPFRQRVRCTMVSKAWQKAVNSPSGLWTDMDLTGATKYVHPNFISNCINRSKHRMTAATLYRVKKVEPVVEALAKHCNSLRSLTIRHNDAITVKMLDCFSIATKLSDLNLSGAPLSQQFVRSILVSCPQLRKLMCSDVTSDSSGIAWPPLPPQLETLTLDAIKIPARVAYIDLHSIFQHRDNTQNNLRTFRARSFDILNSAQPLDLGEQTQLEELHLETGMMTWRRLPRSLRVLSIVRTAAVYHMQAAPETELPNLESLTCHSVRDMERLIYSDCREPVSSITSLSIYNGDLTDDWDDSGLLSERFRKLKHLVLSGARHADTNLAMCLVQHTRELQSLDLSFSDITGYGIKMLVERLPDLTKLRLIQCNSLSADAVQWVRERGIEVDCHWGSEGGKSRKVRYGR